MTCGCGKPKPCGDGSCPHKRRAPGTRLMPFSLWVTNYAPVVPKFYWDVESQEQRIYHLSLELDRLRAYINYIFCEVEKLANELAEALDRAEALLDELAEKIREVEQLISELRQIVADITARMNAIEAEFARVSQQAQRAEQTANAAQTAAQQAQQQAQQTSSDLTNLTRRVAALEECCETAKNRISELEKFRAKQEQINEGVRTELDALNVATAENPKISLTNYEASGQISSGPVAPSTQGIYASTMAIDIPVNIGADRVSLSALAVTARIGGNVAFEQADGTKKAISALYLIENGAPAFSEIIGWYCVISRSGLRVRIQFDKPLWKVGTGPNGNYFEERIVNGTPFAPAVWVEATVS